jgi:hypothetical protein
MLFLGVVSFPVDAHAALQVTFKVSGTGITGSATQTVVDGSGLDINGSSNVIQLNEFSLGGVTISGGTISLSNSPGGSMAISFVDTAARNDALSGSLAVQRTVEVFVNATGYTAPLGNLLANSAASFQGNSFGTGYTVSYATYLDPLDLSLPFGTGNLISSALNQPLPASSSVAYNDLDLTTAGGSYALNLYVGAVLPKSNGNGGVLGVNDNPRVSLQGQVALSVATPEPASMVGWLGFAGAGIVALRRRRMK